MGSKVDNSLTKSDLIESLARNQNHLALRDVELAVKSLLEKMSQELSTGDRIEIRGFGSFSLHFRPARMGRNPKSGDAVALRGKYVPHFKPGKELRERVDYVNTDPSKVGQSRKQMEARLKKQAESRPPHQDYLQDPDSSRLTRSHDGNGGHGSNGGKTHLKSRANGLSSGRMAGQPVDRVTSSLDLESTPYSDRPASGGGTNRDS